MAEILRGEKRIVLKSPLKLFSDLKIKDYLMKYNPDLMAIFSSLISLETIPKDEDVDGLIRHLIRIIGDEVERIKNNLFIKSDAHINPPTLNYSYEGRGIEYISYYGENNKREFLRALESDGRNREKSKLQRSGG